MSVLKNIALIGCGNMGKILAEKLGPRHRLHLHDRKWESAEELAQKIKGKAFKDPVQAIEHADLIILAIKPQNLKGLIQQIGIHLKKDQIILSILAGTPLAILTHHFPQQIIVRSMPNLATRYGMGVIGMADCPSLTPQLKSELTRLLDPLGRVAWINESQMDALTSLTGSGPAFFFSLVEAMNDAGVAMGFQTQESQNLTLQMLKGCIALLENTGADPSELIRQIASPNGTTVAGLKVMETENIRGGLIETFLAARRRAHEISLSYLREDSGN